MYFKLRKLTTKQTVLMATLIAMVVVLARFVGIHIGDYIRIDFAFIPLAVMAVYFGPAWAGIGYGVADLLGALLFPRGSYFPGFTLSAIIIGFIYGIFLYNKHFSWWRIVSVKIVVLGVITLGLNTIWLSMLFNQAYVVTLIPRLTSETVMIPIEIVMLGMLQKYLMPHIRKQLVV